jgi:hypothetical protein
MTRGPNPILPIALGPILQSKQTIQSDFPTPLARSQDTIFTIGLAARFAGWTYQAVETVRCDHFFMDLGSAARPTSVANNLGSATLIANEDGSLC